MAESPYTDLQGHLKDELWRVWLRVEHQIRRRWELGSLPRVSDDSSVGIWTPDNLGGLFRAAHAHHAGVIHSTTPETDAGSAQVLEAYTRQTQRIEGRVQATESTGLKLPLYELARTFGLSPRQRLALTFAVMPELDPDLLTAYRYLSHDPGSRGLDARLLSMLVYDTPESRGALARDLSSQSPLLLHRLLEQDESLAAARDSLLYRRMRPAARLVPLLTGEPEVLDAALCDFAELREVGAEDGLFDAEVIHKAVAALRSPDALLLLQGPRGVGKRMLLGMAARRLSRRLLLINGRRLAGATAEAALPVLRALLREARLLAAIPVVADVDDLMLSSDERDELPLFVRLLLQEWSQPLALTLSGDRMPRLELRPLIHLTLDVPSLSERGQLWRQQVPTLAEDEAGRLAERFAAPGGVIALAARAARGGRLAEEGPPDVAALDLAVRNQLHDRIMRMGRKLPTQHDLADLVVDSDTHDTLLEILSCLRERRKVREEWGFKGAAGVSVLFTGDPGVGKTMSAGVLARQLGLSIYEIDLARVVSKWIGETEKNLSEVFDAAEPGHVVLLFNEADSLFGKRTSEVKSANDRYANLETNYLLQRLERFSGLAILTTNLGKSIDPAFRRRFAYDVQFSFPSVEMRAELWRRAFPKGAKLAELNFTSLAERFELSGGFIKVAAERSAYVAAARKKSITRDIIVTTVERMYRERGKLTAVGKLES